MDARQKRLLIVVIIVIIVLIIIAGFIIYENSNKSNDDITSSDNSLSSSSLPPNAPTLGNTSNDASINVNDTSTYDPNWTFKQGYDIKDMGDIYKDISPLSVAKSMCMNGVRCAAFVRTNTGSNYYKNISNNISPNTSLTANDAGLYVFTGIKPKYTDNDLISDDLWTVSTPYDIKDQGDLYNDTLSVDDAKNRCINDFNCKSFSRALDDVLQIPHNYYKSVNTGITASNNGSTLYVLNRA